MGGWGKVAPVGWGVGLTGDEAWGALASFSLDLTEAEEVEETTVGWTVAVGGAWDVELGDAERSKGPAGW